MSVPVFTIVGRAAAAIANARLGRRGLPPVGNVLELLTPTLHAEVMEDARAVLEEIGFDGVLAALKSVEWSGWHHEDEDVELGTQWPCCPSCGAPALEVSVEPEEATSDARPGKHVAGCRIAAALAQAEMPAQVAFIRSQTDEALRQLAASEGISQKQRELIAAEMKSRGGRS